jgi:hypothetical protein
LSVTLEQVTGTNFGAESINFLITNNTNMKFNLSEIKEGKYLEVYYMPTEDLSAPIAIAVNLLPDADLCIYNGVLENFTSDEDNASGTITLKLNDDETIMVFIFSSSTQFYFNDLALGDMLNIYAPGPVLEIEPPQKEAQEVRRYQ